MAYSNNDSFYFAPAAPEESDSCPFLWGETLATMTEAYNQTALTFASGWDTVNLSESSAIPSTVPASNEPVSPTLGLHRSPSQASCWSTVDQTAQDRPATQSWENSFTSSQGWETSIPALAPSTIQTNFWGSRYCVPSSVSNTVNLQNHYRPGTRGIDSPRFTPYEAYRTRTSMYGNPEVGPSSQAFPPFPYETRPTAQPPGWISETTANADQEQLITEEDEVPEPQARCPPGQGEARPHRERNHEDILKLRKWWKVARGSRKVPSHLEAITAVTEIISGLLEPVYNEDRLSTGRGSRTKVGSRRADKEFERRNGTREVYQRLSRYYILQGKRSRWDATELLVEVLRDLDTMDEVVRSWRTSA